MVVNPSQFSRLGPCQIDGALVSSQLRELYEKSFSVIKRPHVHNAFLERIYYLKNRTIDPQEKKSLEKLQMDIEEHVLGFSIATLMERKMQ
jgi:hypothetical protein